MLTSNQPPGVPRQDQGLAVEQVPPSCAHPGCDRAAAASCSYTDAYGATCGAGLCFGHLSARRLCPRHAAIVAAIDALPEAVRPPRPPAGDCHFGLLLQLRDDVEPAIRALLQRRHAAEPGVRVATDPVPREARRGDEVALEIGWSAYSDQGNLDRVSLRLGLADPPLVRVLVNHREVAAEQPYWITRELQGAPPHPLDRPMFARRLAEIAESGLAQTRPEPSWLAT